MTSAISDPWGVILIGIIYLDHGIAVYLLAHSRCLLEFDSLWYYCVTGELFALQPDLCPG